LQAAEESAKLKLSGGDDDVAIILDFVAAVEASAKVGETKVKKIFLCRCLFCSISDAEIFKLVGNKDCGHL